MFMVVGEHVFPFLRALGGEQSACAHHMRDVRFTIPNASLLSRVVDMIDHVPMEDRDTKGDLYEYMPGKIATAGQNGRFRTSRHIIERMVEHAKNNLPDVLARWRSLSGRVGVSPSRTPRDLKVRSGRMPKPAGRMPTLPETLTTEFARRVTAVEKPKTAQRASLAELDALFRLPPALRLPR